MELNLNKTKIKDLSKNESFNFVGFQFTILKKDGVDKIYNYPPPPQKISNLKDKINEILKKNRTKIYPAFYQINLVLRGWCNFYASGNSKQIFQNINYWLWHRVYRYLWNLHKQNFKRFSQRLFKRHLSSFIWNIYLFPNPNPNWKRGRWWGIPVKRLPTKARIRAISGNNKPYYLYHPASHTVATPSIKLGLSAYYPEDRISLENKSMGWRSGIQAEIIKKSKGKCSNCYCSLLDNETKTEIKNQSDISRQRYHVAMKCHEAGIGFMVLNSYETHKPLSTWDEKQIEEKPFISFEKTKTVNFFKEELPELIEAYNAVLKKKSEKVNNASVRSKTIDSGSPPARVEGGNG